MTNSVPPGTSGNTGDHARDEAERAKQAAQTDFNQARTQLREDADKVAHTAREDFDEARRSAGHFAEDQKNNAADQLGQVASAFGQAASDLERENSFVGRYARDLSDGLQRFSSDARNKSLDQMVGDVETFGRRHPAAFLGAAALVGFAAARFVTASAERKAPEPSQTRPRPTTPAQPSASTSTPYGSTASPAAFHAGHEDE